MKIYHKIFIENNFIFIVDENKIIFCDNTQCITHRRRRCSHAAIELTIEIRKLLDFINFFCLRFTVDPEPTESGQTAGHTTCCREWTAERNLKAEWLTHRLFWPPSNSR
jgi:hypothetical protein